MKQQFFIIRKRRNGQYSFLSDSSGQRVTDENFAKKFISREEANKFYEEEEVYNMDNGAWSVIPQVFEVKSHMHLFNMFALNYPHDFIQKVWGDVGEAMLTHIDNKFSKAYNTAGSYGAMTKFWAELDNGHREKLENWIVCNYKG